MNKRIRLVAVLALFALVAGSAISFVGAQDATAVPATTGSINCDSDLILNLYVAENYFGFDKVRDQLMTTSTTPMVDLTAINRGQFAPWFDSSTAMMTTSPLTDDQVTTISGMLSMDDATLQSTLTNGATAGSTSAAPLIPLAVPGEASECAQLRTELNRFFQVVAFEHSTGAMPFSNPATGSTNPELLTTSAPDMTATPAA